MRIRNEDGSGSEISIACYHIIYISPEQVLVQHQCPLMVLPLLQAPCPLLH